MTGEDAEGYLALQHFLEQTAGIVLGPGDEPLVAGRLARLMREEGIGSLRELTRRLASRAAPRLCTAVIDAMTTCETSWFREAAHFRLLTEDALPAMPASRIRIWSAACATGQEPYSLSIAAQEYLQGDPARASIGIEILATDIAQGALDVARRGLYCGALAARGLSEERRQRHFTAQGDCLSVRNEIRQRVLFRQLNLAGSLDVLGQFDVVFCRHVLIYFSAARRREILGRVVSALRPGGFLFLGAGETLDGICGNLEAYLARGGVAYRRH